MRRRYLRRFLFRLAVCAAVFLLYFLRPGVLDILTGWDFFRRPSPLHLLWLVWVGDMLTQLLPVGRWIALGSQKQFRRYERPAAPPPPAEDLRAWVRANNRRALAVLLLWGALTAALGILTALHVLGPRELLLCTAFFYLSDLICVLFWCPFRDLIMKNRCCTTCRIFNWDHLMMFSPFLFVRGFFTWSLFLLSAAVFLQWEIAFARNPARFWDRANGALACATCTDRLCGRGPGKGR